MELTLTIRRTTYEYADITITVPDAVTIDLDQIAEENDDNDFDDLNWNEDATSVYTGVHQIMDSSKNILYVNDEA